MAQGPHHRGREAIHRPVKELLPEDDDYKYEIAQSGFEAGIMAESFHPDTIVIDLALGRSEAIQITSNLRKNPAYETT